MTNKTHFKIPRSYYDAKKIMELGQSKDAPSDLTYEKICRRSLLCHISFSRRAI